MKVQNKKKRKIIITVLMIVAVLIGAGVYAYNMATDVVAETLVTKIAASSAGDTPSGAAAESIYKSMSDADQAKVKEIAANHVSAANVKAVTEYLGNNDTEGLKEYAFENLSSTEISELKDLYQKYN